MGDERAATMGAELDALIDLLRGRPLTALTGAGLSTASGIPDYRGPETRKRARNPIQYRQFLRSAEVRRRYWARSMVGWRRIHLARPNIAHEALAELERAGVLRGVITQNVDGLHTAAGSRRVIELHGSLHQVHCLDCGHLESRVSMQERLAAINPNWPIPTHVDIAPDGDAELERPDIASFQVAPCVACGGTLEPHVVFFGGNVPRARVDAAFALLAEAEALLVAGSSLTVLSGLRFVRRAHERGQPVAIINLGETRGDPLATLCVDTDVVTALPRLVAAFTDGAGGDGTLSASG